MKKSTILHLIRSSVTLETNSVIPSPLVNVVEYGWCNENRLHWRRDVTLGEDHSQVRTGDAPPVVAALNNAVLALMDFLGVRNVPSQMRIFDARPHEALRLLLR